MFFTKEEAKKIIKYTSLQYFLLSDANPNIEACQALSESICVYDSGYYNAALGFILDIATGKRMERNRKKQHKKLS